MSRHETRRRFASGASDDYETVGIYEGAGRGCRWPFARARIRRYERDANRTRSGRRSLLRQQCTVVAARPCAAPRARHAAREEQEDAATRKRGEKRRKRREEIAPRGATISIARVFAATHHATELIARIMRFLRRNVA